MEARAYRHASINYFDLIFSPFSRAGLSPGVRVAGVIAAAPADQHQSDPGDGIKAFNLHQTLLTSLLISSLPSRGIAFSVAISDPPVRPAWHEHRVTTSTPNERSPKVAFSNN